MSETTKTYPYKDAPVLYAELLSQITFNGRTCRLYFTRNDSSLEGGPERQQVAVAQIIMPYENLVNTALFLEAFINDALKRGAVSQKEVDQLRADFAPKDANDVK